MKGIKKRLVIILSIMLIGIICITAVNAHENLTSDDDLQIPEDSIVLKSTQDEEILSEGETGTFKELAQLIQSSSGELTLDKDYKYSSGDSSYSSGIPINKQLTINGNGHTIDGSNSARIFSVSGSNVVLRNITFTHAPIYYDGSVVNSNGYNLNIDNCTFKDNNAQYGLILTSGYYFSLTNSQFLNNRAYGATTLYCISPYSTIDNCTFTGNTATYESGGAVYMYGGSSTIKNSVFTNNTAKTTGGHRGGGALYIYGNYVTVDNCEFYNNSQTGNTGGALYWGGQYGTLKNNKFINNTNYVTDGGAVTVLGFYNTLYNNYYESNSALGRGGGLYFNNVGGTIYNETFVNNHAYTGGGAFLGYDYFESTDMDNSQGTMTNSRFINNTAVYGGGGFDAISRFVVRDTALINNTAQNYGGGASVAHSKLENLTFEGNKATFGGGLFIFQTRVSNSSFTNNNATYGNSVYVITESWLINNTYDDEDFYLKEKAVNGTVIGSHEIRHMLQTAEGYFGFCSEAYNSKPYSGEYDHSMELLKNALTGEPVSDYLKILIYQFVDHIEDLRRTGFHNYVWEFTDRDFRSSEDPIVRHVIELYDSGFRVPTVNACKVLANGTLMYINYSSIITPSSQQNLFLFKFAHGDEINETLTKEALNKTAFVGDDVDYRIVVSNKGTSPIYDLWVEDKDYSKGLVYETWRSENGNWTYDNITGHWKLAVLEAGKSASVILTFKVMVNGTLRNNATSGVGDKNITVDNDTIVTYYSNFTVEKIALNKTVEKGESVEFEIVIRNTGEIALNELFVEEHPMEGLVYLTWYEHPEWSHSIVNNKHRWTFKGSLPVGELTEFIVVYNTTMYGNLTNVVVVGSNETDNKTGNNTTKVMKPDFVVKKNVLTPYVIVGNQTKFEIIVKNTGEVDLADIVVIEDEYYGLTYDHADTGDLWVYSPVGGKHAWRLNSVLTPGSDEYFFVYFNTTMVGNFTNYVVATSNKTDNKTGNNTTVVNKTVPEEGNNSNFTVQKITIDKTVVLGDLVEFQIIVKNTGNATIHNLTIYESEYEGLIYNSYVDHFNIWQFNPDELSWRLKDDFAPGEELGIHVIFNTTRVGTFTNCVVVTSNQTDNKTGNNTTKVLKPGIHMDKVALNKTVNAGEQVTFEIVVHNTGEETLSNVTVRELDYEGLVYDHFIDYTGFWLKNSDLSWTLNRDLVVGEYESLFIVFKTTKRGNFTNVAFVGNNETNDTDNDTVHVRDYSLTVSKITINKVVKVGDKVEFEIVVTNNGDFDLENVFVRESKYDSGLDYVRYYSVDGNWKYSYNAGKPLFTLDSLKIGESASFRVIFKVLSAGNFSNTVEAGYNNTTVANSTNTTEGVNKTVPKNDTNKKNETPDKPKKPEVPIEKNNLKTHIDKMATGNPLLVLLLALILIPLRRFKK